MEFAIQSFFNSWLVKHPSIFWLLQHPIISLVGLFLGIVLLLRLFSVIAKISRFAMDLVAKISDNFSKVFIKI